MRRAVGYAAVAACILALAAAGPITDAARASTIRWENVKDLAALKEAAAAFGRDLLAATARQEGKSRQQIMEEARAEGDWKNDLCLAWIPADVRAQIPRTVQASDRAGLRVGNACMGAADAAARPRRGLCDSQGRGPLEFAEATMVLLWQPLATCKIMSAIRMFGDGAEAVNAARALQPPPTRQTDTPACNRRPPTIRSGCAAGS